MGFRSLGALKALGYGTELQTLILAGSVKDGDVGLLVNSQPLFKSFISFFLQIDCKTQWEVVDSERPREIRQNVMLI